MPKTFRYIFYILVAGTALYSSIALAQWDVTDQGGSKDIKSMFKDKPKMEMKTGGTVELQADKVEYASGDNVAKASGNVVVTSGTDIMYSDYVELDRTRQEGMAKGHVYLDSPQFQVDADSGKFNFAAKTGEFENARIFNDPMQIKGRVVSKVSDTHMVMEDGYMTTCDLDEPHFRMQTKRMDVYTGDKAIARGVTMYLGRMPVMYIARYVQDLKNKPWFTFMPGSKKDLGFFLLTQSRIKINDYVTTTILVDAYERMGFGLGSETKYKTKGMGDGLLRTYFINERQISTKHPWQMKIAPTQLNERYRLEWRHKWDIDPQTQALWQYYRLSDNVFLDRYFQREFRRDPSANTYFLLTRAMPMGSLSFRVDHRVNRFVQAVDRTPEINYSAASVPLTHGFYLATNNTFSNLVNRQVSPTEDRRKTIRFDTDNLVSYPTHIAFVQFVPNVGGDWTYYSRTIDDRRPGNIVRGTFKTGADLSTRFMKVFNLPRGLLGTDLRQFRHIIAPSVSYKYQHIPTFVASRLNQFDSAIDGLDKSHTITYSLENKLQTKRGKETIDLLRDLATIDYTIKQKGVKGQLGDLKNLIDFYPYSWLRASWETTYSHKLDRLKESTFELYFTKGQKFGFDVGDHYVRGGDHQFITQFAYVVNPKWKFKVYDRFDVNTGNLKQESYSLTRDLHEWEVNLVYENTHGSGTQFLMTFTLKAFPGQPFDLFGTTFHQRKTGSQSIEGP